MTCRHYRNGTRAVELMRGGGSPEPGPNPITLLTAGSRDLMLHGRFDEATVPLVELRDELRKVKAVSAAQFQ